MTEPAHSSKIDEQLNRIIAEYLGEVDAGRSPDRRALLARHPQLAAELRAFFVNHDQINQVASPSRAAEFAGRAVGDLLAGRFIGNYELLSLIARGGISAIFKARRTGAAEPVALKVLLGGTLASAEDQRRFPREAAAAVQLQHPGIVPVHEVGEHEGYPYFTMQLMEGGSLADRASDFRLPILDRRTRQDEFGQRWTTEQVRERKHKIGRLLLDVARAVHFVHENGILHRDLKPSNILLDAQDRPRVGDVGLAKDAGAWKRESERALERQAVSVLERPDAQTLSLSDVPTSEPGALVGTPGYMAPEQAAGGNQSLTPAADVYSLGVMLYGLLIGHPPFHDQAADPAGLRTLNPQVDRSLEAICLKCLKRAPGERYPSANALAKDLDSWLAGRTIPGLTIWSKLWKWLSDRRR
jgi:serine/threonine protein kinase